MPTFAMLKAERETHGPFRGELIVHLYVNGSKQTGKWIGREGIDFQTRQLLQEGYRLTGETDNGSTIIVSFER